VDLYASNCAGSANGMAGHNVAGYLAQQGHTVTAVDRSVLDIEKDNVDHFFETVMPTLL
jgi:nucleoside-diphosphate-sugar epimerase